MAKERTLVVVPCGLAKVWDREVGRGATQARDAYTGSPFKVNRKYAERHADRWVILSAKYGFIDPDFLIPGPYNVTFKRPSPEVVTVQRLREQADALGLRGYRQIIGLGGREYRAILDETFAKERNRLSFPFAGLPIGKAMQAANQSFGGKPPSPQDTDRVAENRLAQRPEGAHGDGYAALAEHLRRATTDVVTLQLSELELLIGRRLPASARKHPAWWANSSRGGHSHARAWLDEGWRAQVDLPGGAVTFRRVEAAD